MHAHDTATATLERSGDAGLDKVEAHLFTRYGKWKYEVRLDYTGLDITHWDHWALARQALAQATANGTSGVIISDLGDQWNLVVINGPAGFPMMVTGA